MPAPQAFAERNSPAFPRSASASAVRHNIVVLVLALAARLLVLWDALAHHAPQWFFARGMEMGLLARSVLAGQGLSSPFGPPTGPTAFIAPVYPLLVAFVFRIFGAFSVTSEVVILSAHIALNLLTIWLMMHIARSLFDERAAVLAGLIWACSFPLIWLPTIFWETSLSICLLVGLLALALHCVEPPARSMWIALGAYCGFAALVNPALLLSVIAVAAWIAFQTRRQAKFWPIVSVLTFAIVFSPWPLRNARVFHAFIPLRTTVGFELWMGNRPGATGFLVESLFPTFNPQELADYQRLGEVGYTAHKSELAKAYIATHPGAFVGISLKRAFRFWTGTGTEHGSVVFAIHSVATTLFGFIGLGLLLKSRRRAIAALFALPLVLFPLPYIITHAEFRYRVVLDPLLAILAAYAVTALHRAYGANSTPLPQPRPASSPHTA